MRINLFANSSISRRFLKSTFPNLGISPNIHFGYLKIWTFHNHHLIFKSSNPPIHFPKLSLPSCRPQSHHTKLRSANPTQKIAANPRASILYRKIYKIPTPYLPLFSAFPSAHAQANNPEFHSNTRNIFDNKRPRGRW